MKYTSAEAGKLLKKLNDERASILLREEKGKEFLAAVGEDIESVRPDYNFKETQNALDEIETKMRKLKHALKNEDRVIFVRRRLKPYTFN